MAAIQHPQSRPWPELGEILAIMRQADAVGRAMQNEERCRHMCGVSRWVNVGIAYIQPALGSGGHMPPHLIRHVHAASEKLPIIMELRLWRKEYGALHLQAAAERQNASGTAYGMRDQPVKRSEMPDSPMNAVAEMDE